MSYQPLYIKELKTLIQPSRYDEFIHFIRTGEASNDFLKYIEEDPLCKEAIQKVLDHQTKVFAEIGKEIKSNDALKEYESSFWMDMFTGIAIGMAVTIIFFLIFEVLWML